MLLYDIFCDASIILESKIACAGCTIVDRNTRQTDRQGLIQYNATNNSAEILAIWLGVKSAIQIKHSTFDQCRFRLFSDSKISLYGLKYWMDKWVAQQKDEYTLINSTGTEVMNQSYFRDIYNMIVHDNLYIEFYHQRGHVSMAVNSLLNAEKDFKKSNSINTQRIGVNIEYISTYNTDVDNFTREALQYFTGEDDQCPLEYIRKEGFHPIDYSCRREVLPNYKELTNGGINNLNGGN